MMELDEIFIFFTIAFNLFKFIYFYKNYLLEEFLIISLLGRFDGAYLQ